MVNPYLLRVPVVVLVTAFVASAPVISSAGPTGDACRIALADDHCEPFDQLDEDCLFLTEAIYEGDLVYHLTPLLFGETMIAASDAQRGGYFGYGVALSDDNLLVSAPGSDSAGQDAGAAYFCESDGSGGFTETKITPTDAQPGDLFGYRQVAMSSGNLLIASPYSDSAGPDSGAAYFYEPNGSGGFTETKLTASDARPSDHFGIGMAMSGENLLISAPGSDSAGEDAGAAYYYQTDGSGGFTETKITPSDARPHDGFGHSVAMSGDNILVGAPCDHSGCAGAAYLFQPNGSGGWTETKFIASDAQPGDDFGFTVSIDGDKLVIGAPCDDVGCPGAAYLYKPNGSGGWTETKFVPTDAQSGDNVGFAVSISGESLLVGVPYSSSTGHLAGAAYFYQPDGDGGFTETKITPGSRRGGYFGLSVAMDIDSLFIGAPANGAAYLYDTTSPGFGVP